MKMKEFGPIGPRGGGASIASAPLGYANRTGTSVHGHGRCLCRILGVTMTGFYLFNGTLVTDDVTIEAPLAPQHVLEYMFVCTRWDPIYTTKILGSSVLWLVSLT